MTTIIRVLDSTEGSRLLARPTIVAYDRVEARFSSISEIPVQELTQTAGGGEIGTTTFREAGITLTVLPHIIQDGTILMQVTPEFSVLAGFTNGNPIIDRRSATTTLRIRDGQTTVIGGLLRRAEREDQNGLPGLSKLKFFGVFFRGHESTITESELLVFIKAEKIGRAHV
jgi:general secretion pathway protein D